MAESGTFMGELQRGWGRFWGLPWKWKGSAMAVAAVLLIGILGSLGGGSDDSDDVAPASGDTVAGATAPASTNEPTNTPATTNTPAPTATPTATATPTTPPTPTPTPTPIVLTGAGQTATDPVALPQGVFTVSLTHQGSSNFAVWAYDSAGDRDLLVNEIGSYTGTRWLVGGESYTFDISADGPWTVTFAPIGADITAGDDLAGHGDTVSGVWLAAKAGPVTYEFTHDGRSNFAVWLQCSSGRDLAQNEIGAVNASTILRIEDDGAICFWDVSADGNWTIHRRR